jgi:mono/diheme cytochrome c family protein
MNALVWTMLITALAAEAAMAQAQPPISQTRGELLYNNHCVECHTLQMHWRNRRQAHDLQSLRAQVQRWQAAASLQWSDADVTEVTRYLDITIYRFAPDSERVGLVGSRR